MYLYFGIEVNEVGFLIGKLETNKTFEDNTQLALFYFTCLLPKNWSPCISCLCGFDIDWRFLLWVNVLVPVAYSAGGKVSRDTCAQYKSSLWTMPAEVSVSKWPNDYQVLVRAS
jgi:hypothetical protein